MSTMSHLGAAIVLAVLLLASFGVALGAAGAPHNAVTTAGKTSGGCPSSNAIGNFLSSSLVGAYVGMNGSTWSYYFSSFYNLSPASGVPGLIEYCVYPNGSLPSSSTASAVGADGSAFLALSGTHQGYFGFGRSHGDPSNVPLNGVMNTLMGTADWSSGPPSNETILLHINDATECQALYGGSSTTCFVLPGAPPTLYCGGNPSCKTALVAEANTTNPLEVPTNTQLHVHYTYTIANAFTNAFNMEIVFPGVASSNFTGVRDFFNCSQVPDPNATPGTAGFFSNYQGTGLNVNLRYYDVHGKCMNLVLRATAGNTTIVLKPGQSISWTLDTITGTAGFSGRGWHCLNEGVTFVWLQSNDGLLHRYTSPDVDVWTA